MKDLIRRIARLERREPEGFIIIRENSDGTARIGSRLLGADEARQWCQGAITIQRSYGSRGHDRNAA